VPGLLEAAQHHDLDEAADVERWRGRIEADIARHDLLRRKRIEARCISDLVDIAAVAQQAEEGRGLLRHDGGAPSTMASKPQNVPSILGQSVAPHLVCPELVEGQPFF